MEHCFGSLGGAQHCRATAVATAASVRRGELAKSLRYPLLDGPRRSLGTAARLEPLTRSRVHCGHERGVHEQERRVLHGCKVTLPRDDTRQAILSPSVWAEILGSMAALGAAKQVQVTPHSGGRAAF